MTIKFNFPTFVQNRDGIKDQKPSSGDTFKRVLRGETLPIAQNGAKVDITGDSPSSVDVTASNTSIEVHGPVSAKFTGSGNTYTVHNNEPKHPIFVDIQKGSNNNTIDFQKNFGAAKVNIPEGATGNKLKGNSGDNSEVEVAGAKTQVGSPGQPFGLGNNATFRMDSTAAGSYVNLSVGAKSHVGINAALDSSAYASQVTMGPSSQLDIGSEFKGSLSVYAGSGSTVNLPGYHKTGESDGPNGGTATYQNDDASATVNVSPKDATVNTDPPANIMNYMFGGSDL